MLKGDFFNSQLKRIVVPLLFFICAVSLTASDAPKRYGPTTWGSPAVSPFIRALTQNATAPLSFINSSATINTDRDDYSPGQTANITGSGWQPGESVRLQVVHIDPNFLALTPHAGHDPWYVTADSEGWVRAQWYVGEDSAGQTLLLTAD